MPTKIFSEPTNLLLAQTLNDLINSDSKLTPASLARKLRIPTNKITRILNGDVTDPKASTLIQIAECFGITINQLLGLEPISRQGEYGDLTASQLLPVFAMSNMDEQTKPKEWYRWVENTLEGNYYALSVDTDLYEPTFPQNSLLIVNPDVKPDDRSFVVVKSKNNPSACLIRKYVIEGDNVFLYPINPKHAIETYDDTLYNVIGIILEIHQKLHARK